MIDEEVTLEGHLVRGLGSARSMARWGRLEAGLDAHLLCGARVAPAAQSGSAAALSQEDLVDAPPTP